MVMIDEFQIKFSVSLYVVFFPDFNCCATAFAFRVLNSSVLRYLTKTSRTGPIHTSAQIRAFQGTSTGA